MTDPGGVLFDRERLERAFTALGDRLVRRGVVADVFIVGGAAMALAYDATRVTRDVDSLFVPHGQRHEAGSVLRLCRDLLALRSAEHRGQIAPYRQLPGPENVWAFQAGRLRVTANLSDLPADVGPPGGPVAASSGPGVLQDATLAPWSGIVTRPRNAQVRA